MEYGKVVDPKGDGVAGACISMYPVGSDGPPAVAYADAAGEFPLPHHPGIYSIMAHDPDDEFAPAGLDGWRPGMPAHVTLREGCTLRVICQDEAGNPVPTARILARAVVDGLAVAAKLDRLGTAELRLMPGRYHVAVSPVGLAYVPVTLPFIDAAAGDVRVTLTRRGVRRITGQVADALGRALPGVMLRFISTDPTLPTRIAVTGANGCYALTLAVGTYGVAMEPPPTKLWPRWEAGDIVVKRDIERDWVVPEPRILRGQIMADGQPVSGATLRLFQRVPRHRRRLASYWAAPPVSDAEGRFSVPLLPGLYGVAIKPPATSSLVAPALHPVALDANLELVFSLFSGHRMVGGVRTASGEGVPRARLTFMSAEGTRRVCLTDARGAYHTVLPPGIHDLAISVTDPLLADVWVPAIEVVGPRDDTWVLPPVARLAGRVTGGGRGVAHALVKLAPLDILPGSWTARVTTSTRPDGSFALSVPLGHYRIAVEPPPGARFIGTRRIAEVTGGDWEEIPLAAGSLVEGCLLDGGADIPPAEVHFQPHDPSGWAGVVPSPSGGRFRAVVPPGVYHLRVTPVGDHTQPMGILPAPITVGEGEVVAVTIDIEL